MSVPMFGPARATAELRAALGAERVPIQVCATCGTRQYPPREICAHCLGGDLAWRHERLVGTVAASSRLHLSLDPAFGDLLPATIAMVRLEAGPKVLAWVAPGAEATGCRIALTAARDPRGEAVLVALPEPTSPTSADLFDILRGGET